MEFSLSSATRTLPLTTSKQCLVKATTKKPQCCAFLKQAKIATCSVCFYLSWKWRRRKQAAHTRPYNSLTAQILGALSGSGPLPYRGQSWRKEQGPFPFHFLYSRMSFHPAQQEVEGNFFQSGLLGSTARNRREVTHILKGTSTPPDSCNTRNPCQVLWRGGKTRLRTLRLTPTSSLCTGVLNIGYTLESPGSLQIWCLDASHRENYLLGCGNTLGNWLFFKLPVWF